MSARSLVARHERPGLMLRELVAVIALVGGALAIALPRIARIAPAQSRVQAGGHQGLSGGTANFPNWTLHFDGEELLLRSDGKLLQRFRILSSQQGPTYTRVIARCDFSLLTPAMTGRTLRMTVKESTSAISVAYSGSHTAARAWPSILATPDDDVTRLTFPKEHS
jgi:hypothetical protein